VGTAAAAGLVVTALLTSGASAATPRSAVNDVMLVNARRSICGASAVCPNDPAPDAGDQATAEQRIIDGYIAKQKGCTPDIPPQPPVRHPGSPRLHAERRRLRKHLMTPIHD
jgi:hypothetical protein